MPSIQIDGVKISLNGSEDKSQAQSQLEALVASGAIKFSNPGGFISLSTDTAEVRVNAPKQETE